MEPIDHAMEPRRWVEVHFGEAPLTDVRRVERLKTIAEALAADPPGASIPQLFARPYDVKAAYTFSIIRRWSRRRCKAPIEPGCWSS